MKSKIKPMTPGVPHSARIRAYLAGAIVTAGLCGVAWRAYALQVNDADHYRELAERQHAMNVDIPAPRGDVIDAVGRPLAVSADVDSIWANPRAIHDVTDTADKLAKLIGGDAGALEAKLGGDRKFVWIDRQVAREVAAAVRAAKLPGIEVAKEPRRWYPGKTIGGPVIGRADIDSRGIEGIELSMNDVLIGSHGEGQAVRDARGKRMFADGLAQPEPGATVRLSLDRSIQSIADQALATAVTTNKAKNGVVVVLEVGTGRVLAMSSYPTYDPNSNENHAGARNRPVTDAYEAGSLLKVFTVAAAIDDGTVSAQTNFDTGSFVVGPKRITDVHPFPSLTVSEIIKHSSNIGAAKIALRLGRDKLYGFLQLAGFGAKTGIELPGESVGMLRKGGTWRDIELATIAFGYGLTVTPIQLAGALAAIGSDGIYHPPRVIDRVTDPDGTVLYQPLDETRRLIKPATAASMRKILATVFEGGKEGGTAKDVVVAGFRCGGKTGTAYKYDRETKHYATDRYMSSFAGLAPIDNPRIAIVVMIDEPSAGNHYGGTVAGPVFGTVASETLRYLGVPGSSLVCPPPPPGYNPFFDTAVKTCVAAAPVPKLAPAKPVVAETPPPLDDASQPEPEPTPLPNGITIPDFRGLGVARALDLARQAHLGVEVSGSGRVIAQDPMAGSVAAAVRISLTFSDGAAAP